MKNPLPIKIAGVGRYLPKRIVTNEEIEKMAGLEIGTIEKTAAGVVERRWVDDETSSWMGAQAANEALVDAGLTINDIDLILNGSGTQEQAIPDGAHLIQRHLGMGESGIPCMSVHTTCLSFLVSMNVAANFIASGQHKNILIIAADIASHAINPKEPESFVLFGDAAAAVVVTKPEEGEPCQMTDYIMRSYGAGAYYTCVMGGGTNRHPNMPATKPEDNLFHMDGWKVYKLARKYGIEALEALRPGLTQGLGDIQYVIPHQASMLAVKTYSHFGWPEEKIGLTLDKLGNCIGASIPVTFYQAVKDGKVQRGDKILFVGTGAGLCIGAAIVIY